MRRLLTPGIIVPLLVALVGGALIIAGQLNLDQGPLGPTLPPIGESTRTPSPSVTPSPSLASTSAGVTPSGGPSATPTASPTPNPSWVAVQIEIQTLPVINLRLHAATTTAQCSFPPEYDAWILLCGDHPVTVEPGRGGNTYIFAHARTGMFLPLWNVQLGAQVKILMSDGQVLQYRVTEIHPNVSCPDSTAPTMPPSLMPPALRDAPPGCAQGGFWTGASDHERLTLQTSQGYNRNWGEFIVVADPVP